MYRVVIDTTISNVLVPFMDVGFYTSIYFLRFFILRDVDKKIITLPEIRETGVYLAELKLHPEVTAQVRLNVYGN